MPANDAATVKWFEKAAGPGQVEVALDLGMLYQNGQGVPKDYSKAVYWCQESADEGYAPAEEAYAEHLEFGTGVSKDRAADRVWCAKVAGQSNAVAGARLGSLKLPDDPWSSLTLAWRNDDVGPNG